VGRQDLIPHQYAGGSKGDEVVSQLEGIFLTKTRDEWIEYLEGFEICHGPVNDFQGAFSDPQVLHREMVFEVDHPTEGHLKQVGFPIKFSETPGRVRLPSPGYGEHTGEVLKELGYADEKIKDLGKSGVI
jgi:crotonobetainyl-CoA:carnitine CoA-transferase CaiB-like acyl-CoA transferase